MKDRFERKYLPADIQLGMLLHDALCGGDDCKFERRYSEGMVMKDENAMYNGMAVRLLALCNKNTLALIQEIFQEVADERERRRESKLNRGTIWAK